MTNQKNWLDSIQPIMGGIILLSLFGLSIYYGNIYRDYQDQIDRAEEKYCLDLGKEKVIHLPTPMECCNVQTLEVGYAYTNCTEMPKIVLYK